MIAVIRFGVTSRAAASSLALSCIGSMYSSRNTLPGCIRALTRAILAPGVGSGGSPSAASSHGGDSWQQEGCHNHDFVIYLALIAPAVGCNVVGRTVGRKSAAYSAIPPRRHAVRGDDNRSTPRIPAKAEGGATPSR